MRVLSPDKMLKDESPDKVLPSGSSEVEVECARSKGFKEGAGSLVMVAASSAAFLELLDVLGLGSLEEEEVAGATRSSTGGDPNLSVTLRGGLFLGGGFSGASWVSMTAAVAIADGEGERGMGKSRVGSL